MGNRRLIPKDFVVNQVKISGKGEMLETINGVVLTEEGQYVLESLDGRLLVVDEFKI